MSLAFEPYPEHVARVPRTGRHVLAQHDERSVLVYQAYRPAIGRWSAEHGRLGGEGFSLSRMSWVKPNFLWMMFRSGWGTKPDQEVTLAVRLPRAAFDELLAQAVPSTWGDVARRTWPTEEAWKSAVAASDVRLQWDPDHHPAGNPVERRAVQLGLRGAVLRRYAQDWPLEVIDLSDHVAAQRAHVAARAWDRLLVPVERVYVPGDASTSARVACDRV